MVGEGIVTFGVRLVSDLRYSKSATWIGEAWRTLPVTCSTGGAKSMSPLALWKCAVRPPRASTPSSCSRKSIWKYVLRYSPSVTPCRPASSCMRTTSRIARSSNARSSCFEISPFLCRSRAASSSGGLRKLPTWSARNGGLLRTLMAFLLIHGSDAGVLEVLDLVEFDVVELAVDHLALADVDVLHDVARGGIDGHRSPRTRPGHALHCLDDLLAVGRATGLLQRFVDEMHAVVASNGHEVGPHTAVGLHERVDVCLVLGRVVRRRVVLRSDHPERGRADRFEDVVVQHVAGSDQADAGILETAFGELLEHCRSLS